jgi:AAHS family 4-hydroxybenzoate transporter-like MFS transporter
MGFLAPAISDDLGFALNSFGPIFAAGLIGLMIGSLTMGPIADRWGRKWPLVVSTMIFAASAAATGRVGSFDQLLVLRLLTGLGLGGAMPNVVAIASEYAPKRIESTVVAALFCGMPLGALLAGVVASVMIPIWGWRSVFYVGGFIPFVISLIVIGKLPESVQFLIIRQAGQDRIRFIMAQIAPDLMKRHDHTFSAPERPRQGIAVKYLFSEGRAARTILLWVPYFMNLLILYFIMSWLPAILRDAAMPFSAGVMAISLFSLGGVLGSALQGLVMDRYGAFSILLAEFSISTLFIASIAYVPISYGVIMPVTFLLGWCVQSAQSGLNVLAAEFYPVSIHSTGIGWALGVGRVGSIIGPVLGGVMLTLQWNVHQIFLAGTLPALCSVAALFVSSRLRADGSMTVAGHP